MNDLPNTSTQTPEHIADNIWSDVVTNLDTILIIIGFLGLIIAIFRFIYILRNSYEWGDNVKIDEFPAKQKLDLGKGIQIQYYIEPKSQNNTAVTKNLITPQNNILKNVVLKKREYTTTPPKKHKYKTIQIFTEITPSTPLCLVLQRPEGIPLYMLEWTCEYGGHAQYYFYENTYNGDNNIIGIKYKFGILAKIRKFFEIK